MKDGLILLIEDNPDDEKLTIRALKKNNIANPIKIARDGQAALDFLFDAGNMLPALVLLDLKLPKVGGLEILQKMRSDVRLKPVPVVVLTSSKEDTDVIKSYDFGCNSYVRKPVDFDRFSEAVRQLGMYWLVLNEPLPEAVTAKA